MSDAIIVDQLLSTYAQMRRLDSSSMIDHQSSISSIFIDCHLIVDHLKTFANLLPLPEPRHSAIIRSIAIVIRRHLAVNSKHLIELTNFIDISQLNDDGQMTISPSEWYCIESIVTDEQCASLAPLLKEAMRVVVPYDDDHAIDNDKAPEMPLAMVSLRAYKVDTNSSPPICADISGDGAYLAIGMDDSSIRLCRLGADSAPLSIVTPTSRRLSIDDGRSRCDASVRMPRDTDWLIAHAHSGAVYDLKFIDDTSDQRRLLSASYDRTVRLVDIDRGGECVASYIGHTASIWKLSISRGRFATGSLDRRAHLYDFERRRPIRSFIGHEGSVDCLQLIDDHLLLTGSDDGSIRLWSINSAMPIRLWYPFVHGIGADAVALSADRKRVYCMADDGKLYSWSIDADRSEGARMLLGTNERCLTMSIIGDNNDNQWLGVGGSDGTVRIIRSFDAANSKEESVKLQQSQRNCSVLTLRQLANRDWACLTAIPASMAL